MPVRAIADLAHARGALVIVDGAQSAGAIPVDLTAIGADAYAIPGQKWLLGPEGTGALAVAGGRPRAARAERGRLVRLRADRLGRRRASLADRADATRGPTTTAPSVIGMARSIGWLSCSSGLPWIYERGAAPGAPDWDRLAAIHGVDVLTPRDHMATLSPFRVAGWTAQAVMDELGARVFAIVRDDPADRRRADQRRWFTTRRRSWSGSLDTVELLAAHTPETVPPRRTLTMLGEETVAPPGRPSASGLGGGPLAAVPQRAAPGRPGRPVQPGHRGRAGRRLPRLRRRPGTRRDPARRRPARPGRGRLRPHRPLVGSVITYLSSRSRPAPARVRRRSGWSAALGFFAAVPIAWLVMVAATQIVRPLLG